MIWIIEHFNTAELLILSIFPLLGLIFQFIFSKNRINKIIVASAILLLPIVTGYDFVISWFYELCVTIISGSFFSFFLKGMNKSVHKYVTSIVVSIALFTSLGIIAFFDAFAGFQKTEETYTYNSFTVKYVRDQGFSGRPLMKYEVYHTPFLGLYNKKIQTITSHSKKYNDCTLIFEKAEVEFDKCDKKILSIP